VCCFPFAGFSQLCTGSLGDPVVNITFGTGSNPGAPLSGTLTNYTYTANGCPNDGTYTVANSSASCFNNAWHAIAQDHTPNDANGYYMLVNSSLGPGDFYVSTVSNLCGGTTYEFAAWIMNVLRPQASGIKPNVTFSIETTAGTVLKSFSTGDIPETNSPVWTQYGFFFQTPQNVNSVVIRMRNNAPGGNGNDLALDDITFRPCGAKTDVAVQNYGTQKNIVVCQSGNQNFTIQSSTGAGFANPAYQWQSSSDGMNWTDIANANQSSLTITLANTGTYYYRVTTAESANISQSSCRTSSEIIQIKISPTPTLSFADTLNACEKDTVQFSVTNAASQSWTGPNGFQSVQPTVFLPGLQFYNSGQYFITVSSTDGCSTQDSFFLTVRSLPVVNAGNDTIACSGKTIQLNGAGGGTLTWTRNGTQLGTGSSLSVTPTQNTFYVLTAKDQYGCTNADVVAVQVVNSPTANAGPDKEIMEGDSVLLNGSVYGDSVVYNWSPLSFMTNSQTLTPLVRPTVDMIYTLTASSLVGCGTSSDNVYVKVYKQITVPNAFTPNGDGINDTWIIDGLQTYPDNEVMIYNRYGGKVFESYGYKNAWKGMSANDKPLPAGVYYYVIKTKSTANKLTGWVMILR
jgi:gliding motility-associated-like protein